MKNDVSDSVYTLNNLSHCYDSGFCLNIPDLNIERGTSLGISGSIGSGKSTLMKILALLEQPREGKILIDGIEQSSVSYSNRTDVTMMLQDPYLLKRTVFENIAYGLRNRGIKKKIRPLVNEALEWIGLSYKKYSARQWYELSGGESRMVALAARLVLKPKVLILDEPLSHIDVSSASLIKNAVSKIREKNDTTLIVSSHDNLWLNSISDEILRLHNGKIVESGTYNIILGPWVEGTDSLWSKSLPNGRKIYATKPFSPESSAILDPSMIIISNEETHGISARNSLQGRITTMSAEHEGDSLIADVDVEGMTFSCRLTRRSVNELSLLPGKKVWIIFKASSLNWQ